MSHAKYLDCVHQWLSLIQQQELLAEQRIIDANSLGTFIVSLTNVHVFQTGLALVPF